MERTARRFLDCVTRDPTLRGQAIAEDRHRALAPLHLLSIGAMGAAAAGLQSSACIYHVMWLRQVGR
jgi:hypothetical protein